jgi:cytochrome P450
MLLAWLGTGLLTSKSKKWAGRRKMLTPTFHFRILDDFLDVFNEQTKTLTQILKKEFGDGKVFDVFPYVTRCALDIISETAFGRTINAQQQRDTEYVKAIYRISELILHRQVRPWFHPDFIWYNFAPLGREEKRCLKILHGFTEDVIAEKKAELKRRNESQVKSKVKVNPDEDLYMSGKKRLAFLDLLLEEQETHQLSDTDIREETDTFMFEGHDTTAANANWTIFLLASYPEYQAKVHEELDGIFGDDLERPITSQDMTQMKYLECCIKESLRIYPSVPFIGRSIETDLQLDDAMTMPAGSTAFIMPYQLHRDPEVFPEPEIFLPDRFFPEHIKGRHPFAYVPFSAGPRNCIGQKFAMMEEKVMMAQFFRHFRAEAAERREDLVLLAELIMRPQNGLHIKIFPRN